MSQTPQALGFGLTLSTTFEEAVSRVTEALKQEGFGILTTIDVTATMKAKLNADMEPYVILGACNPPLAHRALTTDRDIGLLLPCNVIVHQVADGMRVEIVDPMMMLEMVPNPTMHEVAAEAKAKLQRVIASLNASN